MSENSGAINALEQFRRQKDQFFKTHPNSPLTPEQQAAFTGLQYFPEDPALRLTVQVEPLLDQQTVVLQTSTGDVQQYIRYGRLHVDVGGQPVALTLYASDHGFFLPFADSLAGIETYAAGRYLDPQQLQDGMFLVDFNLAYNPYCAYNDVWSCPITPAENRVSVPIRAGERLFGHDA